MPQQSDAHNYNNNNTDVDEDDDDDDILNDINIPIAWNETIMNDIILDLNFAQINLVKDDPLEIHNKLQYDVDQENDRIKYKTTNGVLFSKYDIGILYQMNQYQSYDSNCWKYQKCKEWAMDGAILSFLKNKYQYSWRKLVNNELFRQLFGDKFKDFTCATRRNKFFEIWLGFKEIFEVNLNIKKKYYFQIYEIILMFMNVYVLITTMEI